MRRVLALVCGTAIVFAGAAVSAHRVSPVRVVPPLPQPPQGARAPTVSSTSVWEPLVNGGHWTLYMKGGGARVEVESYDVRNVKGNKVARLRWTSIEGESRVPLSMSLPTQIALSKKGAYFLTDRADDKQIQHIVDERKPDEVDPPHPRKGDDGYVRTEGDGVCIGTGTPPGGAACDSGVCYSEYCLAPGVGVTSLAGNYAPEGRTYTAPPAVARAGGVGHLELSGIPACDAIIRKVAACAANPRLPAELRRAMEEQLQVYGPAFRQMAAASGATDAAATCKGVDPGITESLQHLGCVP